MFGMGMSEARANIIPVSMIGFVLSVCLSVRLGHSSNSDGLLFRRSRERQGGFTNDTIRPHSHDLKTDRVMEGGRAE